MTDDRKWAEKWTEKYPSIPPIDRELVKPYEFKGLGSQPSSVPRPFSGLFPVAKKPFKLETPGWMKTSYPNLVNENYRDVGHVLKTPKRSYVPEVDTSFLDPKVVINRVRKIDINMPNFQTHDQNHVLSGRNVASRIQVNRVRPFARKAAPSDGYETDNGWHKDSAGDYRGFYHVGMASFEGLIESKPSVSAPFKFFILDPPRSFLEGEHRACYHKQGRRNGKVKYFIHFSRKPEDITTGITHIEMELAKSLN